MYREIPDGIESVNFEQGFFKSNAEEKTLTIVTAYIASTPFFVSGKHIADNLRISRSTLKKFGINVDAINAEYGKFRRGIGPKQLPSESSGKFQKPHGTLAKEETYSARKKSIEKAVREELAKADRYLPTSYLSKALGVSQSTLGFYGIKSEELNLEYGFFRDNRFFEAQVGKALSEIFPDYEIIPQKWFPDLRSDLGTVLYFDYFVPELNLAVEADGPCHFDKKHPWHTDKVVRRDFLKDEYCKNNGIRLIRIPFCSKVDVSYVSKILEPPESPSTTTYLETEDVTVLKSEGIGKPAAKLLNNAVKCGREKVQRLGDSSESSAQTPLQVYDIVSTSGESRRDVAETVTS